MSWGLISQEHSGSFIALSTLMTRGSASAEKLLATQWRNAAGTHTTRRTGNLSHFPLSPRPFFVRQGLATVVSKVRLVYDLVLL